MRIINELLKDTDNFSLLEHNTTENFYIFVDQKTIRKFKVFPVMMIKYNLNGYNLWHKLIHFLKH